VGEEVLLEGTTQLGCELIMVPSLEVIREDDSVPHSWKTQALPSWKPKKMVAVNAMGTGHGKQWTRRQLIPEGVDNDSSGLDSDCKVHFMVSWYQPRGQSSPL
jgi:hypothetical protein